MRRIPLLCLLAALLIAPAAKAATTNQIIRDCADDGVLEGHYTAAQLRKAAHNLPTDVAEYSDCSDVLARAIAAAAATSHPHSHAGTGITGGASAPTATATPTSEDPSTVTASTPQDSLALTAAAHHGAPAPIKVRGRRVAAGLAAEINRNSLPSSLLIALALVAAAAVAMGAPALRRVLSRRRS
jgi:hypothetical protein